MSFFSLPNEIIHTVFQELNDLNEMLKCRLISRRCKQAVDRIRLTGSLAVQIVPTFYFFAGYVSSHLFQSDVQRFLFTGELIGPTSVTFRAASLNFLKYKFMKKMLAGLRRLTITELIFRSSPDFQQFQTNINQLKKLNQLQIGVIYLNKTRNLRLDHVRTLAIFACTGYRLILTAPALTALGTLSGDLSWPFQLPDQTALTHLAMPGREVALLSGLSNNRIEHLRFQGNPPDLSLVHQIILTYPALRELHLGLTNKTAICEILKQRKISRNLRLVIYFSGLRIDDLDDVEQLFGDETEKPTIELPYIVANFKRFQLADCVRQVNYSELLAYRERLSVDAFLSTFVRIEQVEVGRNVGSEPSFVEFLKRCTLLKELNITSSPFGQAFYDYLHTHCANLEVLRIVVGRQPINRLNFLHNHRRLREFAINQELDIAFVSNLIQLRPNIVLAFSMNGKLVRLVQSYYSWHLEFAGHTFKLNVLNGNFSSAEALRALYSLVA